MNIENRTYHEAMAAATALQGAVHGLTREQEIQAMTVALDQSAAEFGWTAEFKEQARLTAMAGIDRIYR